MLVSLSFVHTALEDGHNMMQPKLAGAPPLEDCQGGQILCILQLYGRHASAAVCSPVRSQTSEW